MSLFDDYKADVQFASDFPFGVPCEEWTTKNGERIAVEKMSDLHIKNCMNLVGEDDPWHPRFQKELERRKEMRIVNNAKNENRLHSKI